jgi:hypothetical protein
MIFIRTNCTLFYNDEQRLSKKGKPLINKVKSGSILKATCVHLQLLKYPILMQCIIIGIVGVGRISTEMKRNLKTSLKSKLQTLENNRLLEERQEEVHINNRKP